MKKLEEVIGVCFVLAIVVSIVAVVRLTREDKHGRANIVAVSSMDMLVQKLGADREWLWLDPGPLCVISSPKAGGTDRISLELPDDITGTVVDKGHAVVFSSHRKPGLLFVYRQPSGWGVAFCKDGQTLEGEASHILSEEIVQKAVDYFKTF